MHRKRTAGSKREHAKDGGDDMQGVKVEAMTAHESGAKEVEKFQENRVIPVEENPVIVKENSQRETKAETGAAKTNNLEAGPVVVPKVVVVFSNGSEEAIDDRIRDEIERELNNMANNDFEQAALKAERKKVKASQSVETPHQLTIKERENSDANRLAAEKCAREEEAGSEQSQRKKSLDRGIGEEMFHRREDVALQSEVKLSFENEKVKLEGGEEERERYLQVEIEKEKEKLEKARSEKLIIRKKLEEGREKERVEKERLENERLEGISDISRRAEAEKEREKIENARMIRSAIAMRLEEIEREKMAKEETEKREERLSQQSLMYGERKHLITSSSKLVSVQALVSTGGSGGSSGGGANNTRSSISPRSGQLTSAPSIGKITKSPIPLSPRTLPPAQSSSTPTANRSANSSNQSLNSSHSTPIKQPTTNSTQQEKQTPTKQSQSTSIPSANSTSPSLKPATTTNSTQVEKQPSTSIPTAISSNPSLNSTPSTSNKQPTTTIATTQQEKQTPNKQDNRTIGTSPSAASISNSSASETQTASQARGQSTPTKTTKQNASTSNNNNDETTTTTSQERKSEVKSATTATAATNSPVPQTSQLVRKNTAIAEFRFEGQDKRELSFHEGDEITILKKDASGWWQGKLNNGVVGWLPGNYVREVA
jgi:hypothetical protein